MRIGFDLRIWRTPLKSGRWWRRLRFFKRVSFRNNGIRHEVSGWGNYERIWMLGYDITLQWGNYDRAKAVARKRRHRAQQT